MSPSGPGDRRGKAGPYVSIYRLERRLAKLAGATEISWLDRVRVELGERLIALGGYLKAPARRAAQLD